MADTTPPAGDRGVADYDVERYLRIRSASGADLAPDGTLAFLMDTTGTRQVWTVSEPGGWPTQHTFYDEGVSYVEWSPERRELAFGMDEGGDERTQLYRLDPETGRVHELTATPDAKHRWGGWSADGERVAFASNRRAGDVFDVYVQGREERGADAELVHEGDGWLSVVGWGPADERLLVRRAHSSFDHDLYLLHLDDGEYRHLTPHDGQARFQSVEWGPDGEAAYLVTDRDTDRLQLARVELATGDLSTVVADADWNVDGVAVDDSGRVVYSKNVDGYTELAAGRLNGPASLELFAEPSLPSGTAGGVSFGPDGEQFALTVSGRTINENCFVVETATGAGEQWTHAGTAGIPRETFVEPELVHYPTFDGREIPAFFSTPEADTEGLPVVVDVHGGPESQRRPGFGAVKQYLLANGYAVFEPNVRGSAGYGREYASLDDVRNRMDAVEDLRAGAEWLHDHPSVDPDRIALMGGSYGGFMVLAGLTEYPELWAAGVDIVGIANFVTFLENTGDWRQSLREAEYGSLADDREFLASISPINNADRIDAPLFVLHGENDPRVPVGEAEQIVTEVRDRDVPVRKLIFDDEGHGFAKRDNQIEAYRGIVGFLDDHV
ncbi:MAG: dipeptidyl acylaminoacyl-peptidase [halophilic archaeon J07HB67]|jgi:Dipeptidyl aminopeptidases/acylaminoacyl-peptidases|nr:MAG: dipeptidyl acylaminoacyl-peptidase [halophilic archaeon J07HB67]